MSYRAFLTPLLAGLALVLCGCPMAPSGNGGDGVFSNMTDKTNGGASYIGSSSCQQCHPQISAMHRTHGHANALTPISGDAPTFPPAAARAVVPDPPQGFQWSDIPYIIAGYTKAALFIDRNGFILTTGEQGIPTQWALDFPTNGTAPGFVDFEAGRTTPLPFDFSCFQCHTTGAMPQDAADPQFQENRAGFAGTWVEPGVQCEACHGPGSGHFTTVNGQVVINTHRIFVDPNGDDSCRQCHTRPYGDQSGTILASDGFISSYEQWPELRASGGHSNFACTYCHDPHRSANYDSAGIRNECSACHGDMTMAGHGGKVFTRGDFSETLSCESCHMPYATKTATQAGTDVVGDIAHVADTHTHIFRIDMRNVDYRTFFTDDGSAVRLDDQGRAAVTVDFVCLRCHNDQGDLFELTVEQAAEISERIHDLP